MKDKAQLCICNNCGTVMIDKNPSNQYEFVIPANAQDMEYIKDEDCFFYGCPVCKTDEYLDDVTKKAQLTTI